MRRNRNSAKNKMLRAVYFFLLFIAIATVLSLLPLISYMNSYTANNCQNTNSEYCTQIYEQFFFYINATISLSFLVSSLLYLRFIDPNKTRGVDNKLGLDLRRLSIRNLFLGVFVFIIIFILEIGVGLISRIANVQINTNVNLLFAGAPFWFYIFTSLISPVNEEVLFRGLMVPRLGVVVSALLFAVLHAGYGSTYSVEVIAAFVFGLISGYVLKKTKSLYPSIVAHVLVNTLTVLVTFAPGV